MDYFHSSTGVTETTCYVPFKFAGIGGVSIADFRAMSQKAFWGGQPQHDNLAGHSFLSFFDGQQWQHLKYESTIYRSTGPNWFDIQLNYLSADESIRVKVDVWETPQVDELRSFFKARYDVLKPLVIESPHTDFRLLEISSAIQQLRFTRFAANGTPDLELDPSQAPFPVKGLPLPAENAYLALYGDSVKQRGSNAVIIRKFTGPQGITPAASVQWGKYQGRLSGDAPPNTRLLLVPDAPSLILKPGDRFEIDGYWLPYGPMSDAVTPRRELTWYGQGSPRVSKVTRGQLISDLPVIVKAQANQAQFSIQGGRDLIPVIVKGLTTWDTPRLWKKEKRQWRLLSHARNTEYDGYQVFCAEDDTFGAVFLVHSNEQEQQLRISVGKTVTLKDKIELSVRSAAGTNPSGISIASGDDADKVTLNFPGAHAGASLEQASRWQQSEGHSLWFQSKKTGYKCGGRLSPNETCIDLEYWWQIQEKGMQLREPLFTLETTESKFADPDGSRTWMLSEEGWAKARTARASVCAIAIQSADRKKVLAMAWNKANGVSVGDQLGISLEPLSIVNKRVHVRGKIYLMEADLSVVADRIWKETIR